MSQANVELVGETGFEPVWLAPRHFKCLVYPNSTTRPSSYPFAGLRGQRPKKWEAGVGIEPAYTALQAAA